jgi:HlyD family secretion protein
MDLPRSLPGRRVATALAAVAAVVAVGAGASAVAGSGTDAGRYRTAVVSEQQVDQVLRSVGSIEPVSQASVAFPVGGTVWRVDVEVGDQVSVGQSLATLEADDLTTSLHAAEATLAQAELSLELALAGEDPAMTVGGAPAGGSGFGRSASTDPNAALRAAQEAVLEAQRAVDAAMSDAEAALANATQVCAEEEQPTTTTTTTTTAPATSSADAAVCEAALAASLDAQRALAAAQQQLVQASDDLTALLDDRADEEPDVPEAPAPQPEAPSTSVPSGGGSPPSGETGAPSGEPATDAGATSSPSAEELVAYQKAVDAAALEVVVAEHAIEQSTIVSPIAGTVASVAIEPGDEVTAASATQAIVIVSDGGFEVTTSISVTDLPDVAVGQAAEVVPDGATEPIGGQVVRIGVAPDDAGSGSTYALTIGLDGDTSSLGNGSVASVSIVTESSGAALAVPTSAVTITGDQATVTSLVDGEATETDIEIGPIGDRWIAVTAGLDEGDVVVIADLDEPLPGSATDTSSSGDAGGGGFPGGGGLPAGFGPGG